MFLGQNGSGTRGKSAIGLNNREHAWPYGKTAARSPNRASMRLWKKNWLVWVKRHRVKTFCSSPRERESEWERGGSSRGVPGRGLGTWRNRSGRNQLRRRGWSEVAGRIRGESGEKEKLGEMIFESIEGGG